MLRHGACPGEGGGVGESAFANVGAVAGEFAGDAAGVVAAAVGSGA